MFTGWIKPFKLSRPVEREEYYAELPKQRQPGIIPDSYGSLIHINSTYADFIDRRDRLRGMASTTAGILGTLTMLGLWLFFVGFFFRVVIGME